MVTLRTERAGVCHQQCVMVMCAAQHAWDEGQFFWHFTLMCALMLPEWDLDGVSYYVLCVFCSITTCIL